MTPDFVALLRDQFNGFVGIREKRKGIFQLVAPLFHEDGDMMEVFLQVKENGDDRILISDHGMTVMRLSYAYELDTPNKERIFQRILDENGVREVEGNLYIEASPETLAVSVLQFSQAIGKVSNMQMYRREVVQSLFEEQLGEFIQDELVGYKPSAGFFPLDNRDDLEVDYRFDVKPRPIFLFGVKDNASARLTAISCLEFHLAKLQFRSFVVHRDFTAISRKDITRLTSAADKQFPSLDDFRENAGQVFAREIA